MSLLNIVLAVLLILAGIPATIYYLLRIKSRHEEAKEKERFFLRSIVQALQELRCRVIKFQSLEINIVRVAISGPPVDKVDYSEPSLFLDEQARNSQIQERMRRQLRRLGELRNKYKKWLNEAEFISNSILATEIGKREKLKENWDYFFKQGRVDDLLFTIQKIAYPKLFEGTLSLEYVKGAFVREYGTDLAVTITEITENMHEVQIKLREHILDTRDFDRLIEEVIKVGSRTSVEQLRIAQKELLSGIEAAQGDILKRDKELRYEFAKRGEME